MNSLPVLLNAYGDSIDSSSTGRSFLSGALPTMPLRRSVASLIPLRGATVNSSYNTNANGAIVEGVSIWAAGGKVTRKSMTDFRQQITDGLATPSRWAKNTAWASSAGPKTTAGIIARGDGSIPYGDQANARPIFAPGGHQDRPESKRQFRKSIRQLPILPQPPVFGDGSAKAMSVATAAEPLFGVS